VFDRLVDAISGAWWSYPIIFGIAMLDAFFPVVPSETVAITSGVVASSGDLNVVICILAAATGAIVGDNISYAIGRWVGEHTIRRWFRSEKARGRLDWAERQLEERGGYLIVIARFIPGGRTAVTFASGYVHTMPWRRFIVFDVIAGSIWGSYTVLLGYVGGKQFEQQPWKGLILAFLVATGIAVGVEVYRHLRRRQQAA
jgi:membrane-associated protein